jgi:hypothetical protein
MPRRKVVTLWCRQGAKRVFYVSMVRKTGRWIVEMGGVDSQRVLAAIHACRDHFDGWFGIAPEDIQAFERKSGRNGARAESAWPRRDYKAEGGGS